MGKMGRFDIQGLKEFRKQLEKLQDPDVFVESCAKELAARLLRLVIKRTPVGEYDNKVSFIADLPAREVNFTTKKGEDVKFKVKARKKQVSFQPQTGKKGGTLRRGWTASKNSSAKGFAESLTVNHFGDTYVIEIVNPVEYASYVEYGHRTANHKGWVKGQFMMTISEQELQKIAPRVLENKIKKYLGGCIK
jgi:hypothetical protein